MKIKLWHIILAAVILLLLMREYLAGALLRHTSHANAHKKGSSGTPETFGLDDQNYALAALEDLDNAMLEGRIEDASEQDPEEFFKRHMDKIQLVKAPIPPASPDGKEHLTFSHPINTTYWPYYFNSAPYQYQNGGAWPPGMKSRLYNWEPGFSTGTGWSYWLRPGMTYDRWPRNRWVKSNGSFYFINYGKDRSNDWNGEPS